MDEQLHFLIERVSFALRPCWLTEGERGKITQGRQTVEILRKMARD